MTEKELQAIRDAVCEEIAKSRPHGCPFDAATVAALKELAAAWASGKRQLVGVLVKLVVGGLVLAAGAGLFALLKSHLKP